MKSGRQAQRCSTPYYPCARFNSRGAHPAGSSRRRSPKWLLVPELSSPPRAQDNLSGLPTFETSLRGMRLRCREARAQGLMLSMTIAQLTKAMPSNYHNTRHQNPSIKQAFTLV